MNAIELKEAFHILERVPPDDNGTFEALAMRLRRTGLVRTLEWLQHKDKSQGPALAAELVRHLGLDPRDPVAALERLTSQEPPLRLHRRAYALLDALDLARRVNAGDRR